MALPTCALCLGLPLVLRTSGLRAHTLVRPCLAAPPSYKLASACHLGMVRSKLFLWHQSLSTTEVHFSHTCSALVLVLRCATQCSLRGALTPFTSNSQAPAGDRATVFGGGEYTQGGRAHVGLLLGFLGVQWGCAWGCVTAPRQWCCGTQHAAQQELHPTADWPRIGAKDMGIVILRPGAA